MRELRSARSSGAAGERSCWSRRPVRGDLHRLRDEAERAAFIDALCAGRATPARLSCSHVRADFYGRCAAYPALAAALGANHVLVGPMQRDELRRAIERPAQRAGLHVEPELVDALARGRRGRAGGLPLLSTALLELWQRRDGRHLRLATYERTGGVRGAVGALGRGGLRPARPCAAGRRANGPAPARRRRRAAARSCAGASRWRSSRRERRRSRPRPRALTDRRLLTMSATTVEVAHEALLREWPRLRGWLEEDADGRRVHRHLTDAARDWDDRGRDPGDLYRGARLAAALEWRDGHEHELNATERAFLDASRTAAGRAQRRLRLALAGVAALLVVAALGGVVALRQRGSARSEARAAAAERLGVQALTEQRPTARCCSRARASPWTIRLSTRSNLLAALLRNPAAVGVIGGARGQLIALALSPDGRTLATADDQGRVVFLDPVTRRPRGRPYTALTPIFALTYSPDGRVLALTGDDFIDVLDGRTHVYRRRLFAARAVGVDIGKLGSGPSAFFGTVAFSPDSRVLAADVVVYPRHDDIVRWDAATGRRLGAARQVASSAEPALVGFLGRGATGDLWRRPARGRPRRRHDAAGAPLPRRRPS